MAGYIDGRCLQTPHPDLGCLHYLCTYTCMYGYSNACAISTCRRQGMLGPGVYGTAERKKRDTEREKKGPQKVWPAWPCKRYLDMGRDLDRAK